MTHSTLCYLIDLEETPKVCLGMKKRGFGEGKWDGIGGKVEKSDKSIQSSLIREVKEEIGVRIYEDDLIRVAQIEYTFPGKKKWNQTTHVFISHDWMDKPVESEEMVPEWFEYEKIPYEDMWQDEEYWLPDVLNGEIIEGAFSFGDKDELVDINVETHGDLNHLPLPILNRGMF